MVKNWCCFNAVNESLEVGVVKESPLEDGVLLGEVPHGSRENSILRDEVAVVVHEAEEGVKFILVLWLG